MIRELMEKSVWLDMKQHMAEVSQDRNSGKPRDVRNK